MTWSVKFAVFWSRYGPERWSLTLFYVVLKVDLVPNSTWTSLVAPRMIIGAWSDELIGWNDDLVGRNDDLIE